MTILAEKVEQQQHTLEKACGACFVESDDLGISRYDLWALDGAAHCTFVLSSMDAYKTPRKNVLSMAILQPSRIHTEGRRWVVSTSQGQVFLCDRSDAPITEYPLALTHDEQLSFDTRPPEERQAAERVLSSRKSRVEHRPDTTFNFDLLDCLDVCLDARGAYVSTTGTKEGLYHIAHKAFNKYEPVLITEGKVPCIARSFSGGRQPRYWFVANEGTGGYKLKSLDWDYCNSGVGVALKAVPDERRFTTKLVKDIPVDGRLLDMDVVNCRLDRTDPYREVVYLLVEDGGHYSVFSGRLDDRGLEEVSFGSAKDPNQFAPNSLAAVATVSGSVLIGLVGNKDAEVYRINKE